MASRIFLRLIFGGQNSAANSDIRQWLGGLIQPLNDLHLAYFKPCELMPNHVKYGQQMR